MKFAKIKTKDIKIEDIKVGDFIVADLKNKGTMFRHGYVKKCEDDFLVFTDKELDVECVIGNMVAHLKLNDLPY